MSAHLKSCHCCGLIQRVVEAGPAACVRCESLLDHWARHLRHNRLSAAFALAALLLYVPAVTLPFLRISQLGHLHESSLLVGVRTLFEEGEVLVGLVVLMFSIVLPVWKLSALLFLTQKRWQLQPRHTALTYQLVEQLGRWGMLDVLLVAVMVAFIKLGGLVEFDAGIGVILFTGFVLLSLCASATFDPHCLWDGGLLMSAAVPPPPASAGQGEPAGPQDSAGEIPAARPVPTAKSPRDKAFWLIPLFTLLGVLWLVISGLMNRGREIVIEFREGHGIKAGDELRYHGIVAGDVQGVALSEDLDAVQVRVRLTPESDGLARSGSRFWIVRPQANLAGFSGLETVVKANYIAVVPGPGDAPRQSRFRGLEMPPLADLEVPGGLEIVLQSADAEGLGPGVGVYYRNVRVGGIVSSDLSADGGAVESRVYIRPDYRDLVRQKSVFWNMSGVRLQGGLTELSVHLGPVESLLRGGIGLAVPPDAGGVVKDGHRFLLHEGPEEEWSRWQPALVTASADPPKDLPKLVAATLRWRHDGFVRNPLRTRTGWLVPVDGGYLGPKDLFSVPDAVAGSAVLSMGDEEIPLESMDSRGNSVVRFPYEHHFATVATRPMQHPENGFLVTGGEQEPLFVAAARFQDRGDHWQLDPALPISVIHHGGAIVSSKDGAVIGIVSVRGRDVHVYSVF